MVSGQLSAVSIQPFIFGADHFPAIDCHLEHNLRTENRELRTGSSVNHFLLLLIHRHGERLEWRGVYRHGNPLHSGRRWSGAIPAALFRDEIYEKHLSVDFESQFAFLSLARLLIPSSLWITSPYLV